jgi:adenosylcobyric acid synthase
VTRVATGEWISPDLFGRWFGVGGTLRGYEIHLGISERGAGTPPLLRLRRQGAAGPVEDRAVSPDGRTLGTYLHGLFDDDDFRHRFVRNLRAARNLSPPHLEARYAAEREGRFDRLAACVRGALDVRMLYDWLGLPERRPVSEATAC